MSRTRLTETHDRQPTRQPPVSPARAARLAVRIAFANIVFIQIALATVAMAQPGPPPPPAARGPRGAAPTTEQGMLRLAEIMGSLAWLRNLCGANDGRLWRDRMTALIEAESTPPERRQRLAAAWNDSYRAWSLSYKRCTPSAELAIQRYVAEGTALSRALSARIAR